VKECGGKDWDIHAERAELPASLSRDRPRRWLADGGHRTFRDPDFLEVCGVGAEAIGADGSGLRRLDQGSREGNPTPVTK